MTINPIIPLAYNLADEKKRYILFCGAGISKDANVPTGWEILLDTLRNIRNQEEGSNETYSNAEMERYYEDNYKDSTYSEIIEALYPSVEEQRSFLKNIFEGTVPSVTHKAIAKWVKQGLIRFVVTTNFDTLLEQALDDEELRDKYTVISNNEDVLTSKPWNNVECCRIYKIHGTINQGKIRNTEKDLMFLDEDLQKDFLDVIERHGVIVLGYAGNKEDQAVMDTFNKRKFYGYTLYWCVHNNCNDEVVDLIEKQDGRVIEISSASEFLEETLNRVKIARKGSEQTSREVALARFGSILSSGSDIKIKQTINEENKNLIKHIKNILEELDETDRSSMWDAFVKIFRHSMNYLVLAEQITKYDERYWNDISLIFNDLILLEEKTTLKNQKELLDYFMFVFLELMGGILLENQAFSAFKSLLKVRFLDQNINRMKNIFDRIVTPKFIDEKNSAEERHKIFPSMDYLVQLLETEKLPFEWNIKEKVLDADLIIFAYTTMYPLNEYGDCWHPQSFVYMGYQGSRFLKMIAFDEVFGNKVSNELFEVDYTTLRAMMNVSGQKFESVMKGNRHIILRNNPFSIFTS